MPVCRSISTALSCIEELDREMREDGVEKLDATSSSLETDFEGPDIEKSSLSSFSSYQERK